MKKGRPTVYIDMDDTAVAYTKQLIKYRKEYPKYQYPQSIIGFFSTMEPMPGFIEAWNILKEHYNLAFCTRPSIYNLGSYTEKAVWVRDNMGGIEALEDLNLVPKKQIIGEEGDYLVDDWDIHGQKEFRGMHIHFGKDERFMNWGMVADYLLEEALDRKKEEKKEDKYGEHGLGYCSECGESLSTRAEFISEKCDTCLNF